MRHLTERELEITCLVAQGLSNQEIADATFMSQTTAKTFLNRINITLDTSNRVHIAVFVERARASRIIGR